MANDPVPPANHVFPDGMSFANVRDAVIAAAKVNMWHVAYEMAARYKVDRILCLKCAIIDRREQKFTYYTYRGKSIRICLKCNSGNISLR